MIYFYSLSDDPIESSESLSEKSDVNELESDDDYNDDEDRLLSDSSENENDSKHNPTTNNEQECSKTLKQNELDGRSVLAAQQSQAKWEELYPFAFYSASSRGWYFKICQQYSIGSTHWVSQAVNFGEHPNRFLSRHLESNQHEQSLKQKQIFQRMMQKGTIYKQIVEGAVMFDQKTIERN